MFNGLFTDDMTGETFSEGESNDKLTGCGRCSGERERERGLGMEGGWLEDFSVNPYVKEYQGSWT